MPFDFVMSPTRKPRKPRARKPKHTGGELFDGPFDLSGAGAGAPPCTACMSSFGLTPPPPLVRLKKARKPKAKAQGGGPFEAAAFKNQKLHDMIAKAQREDAAVRQTAAKEHKEREDAYAKVLAKQTSAWEGFKQPAGWAVEIASHIPGAGFIKPAWNALDNAVTALGSGRPPKRRRAPMAADDPRRERMRIVAEVMRKNPGMKLPEASKYVKEHSLWSGKK